MKNLINLFVAVVFSITMIDTFAHIYITNTFDMLLFVACLIIMAKCDYDAAVFIKHIWKKLTKKKDRKFVTYNIR